MEHAKIVAKGLNVAPIYWRLLSNPQLWNQRTARTAPPDSPHHGLDDIWARFGDPARATDGAPHDSYWYPEADVLALKPMCYDIMHAVQGDELGGVLLTRIPPGGLCRPHTDPGWHARRYEKYAVQIASHPDQAFCMDDGRLVTQPGDLYWFDNSFNHWVENPSAYERVSMIVCIRKEK